jgi:hypothetical protein
MTTPRPVRGFLLMDTKLFRFNGARDAVTRSIIDALNEHGPLTRAEICERLGLDPQRSAAIISRLNKPTKTLPKRIYIKDYVREDSTSGKLYIRARYAVGNKRDANPIRPYTQAKRNKRYRERQKKKTNTLHMSSVFTLATSPKKCAKIVNQRLTPGPST